MILQLFRNDLEMMKKMKEDQRLKELEIKRAEREEMIYLDKEMAEVRILDLQQMHSTINFARLWTKH